MRGRLDPELIDQLIDAAVDFEFHDRRSMLLSGIPASFRGNIPVGSGGPPRDQLVRDLNWLNEAGLLEDGTDPLAIWLRSAYRAAGGVQKAAVFRRALDQLQEPPEVVGAIWQAPSSRPEYQEAVIHTEDRVPIQFLQDGQRAGESVALVSVTRYEQHEVSTRWPPVKGTGWLIGPTLLITAHHVVNARQVDEPPAHEEDFIEQARRARVTFGYDRDGQTGTAIGVARLVEQSHQLDYVILQLDADPGIPPLRLAKAEPAVSKDYHPPLNIIQHPYGHPKMLAFRNNLATTVAERPSDLGYFTDTDKGASGAPVFNDDWRVVAMHRATAQVDAVVFQGLETAWANVGTRITAIMADLEQRSPDLWRSIKDAQTAASKPPLRLVRSPTGPDGQRLRESADALRERIRSVAQSYGAGQTSWLWDKDSISDELDQVHQELNLIGAWLADTELSTSGVRQALRRHEAVARRFVQRLGDLEAPQTLKAQRLLRRAEFEQAGQALLELLEGIERELRLLGVGDRLPASS